MKTKDQVLIESMFKYADNGIDPCILTENVNYSSVLVEASGEAASLFSRLNDGRKELMKKIENIDWKEWLQKMKETVKKIIRFITAPARTAVELATGKTTLKEVGQRLKQVWTNLKNKRNKTQEEKTAEKSVELILVDVEKAEDAVEQRASKVAEEVKFEDIKDSGSDKDYGISDEEFNDFNRLIANDLKSAKAFYAHTAPKLKIIGDISIRKGQDTLNAGFMAFKDSEEILDLDDLHVRLYRLVVFHGIASADAYLEEQLNDITDRIIDGVSKQNVKSIVRQLRAVKNDLGFANKYLQEIAERISTW